MTMNLYRVVVTQEWSTEAEALVFAPDEATAKRWAEREVEVSIDDAEADRPSSSVKFTPLDEAVLAKTKDKDLWLIADGDVMEPDEFRALDEFRELLDPERLEALCVAQIEAGNGQLDLLEVAS
jgi:hypothetical protein